MAKKRKLDFGGDSIHLRDRFDSFRRCGIVFGHRIEQLRRVCFNQRGFEGEFASFVFGQRIDVCLRRLVRECLFRNGGDEWISMVCFNKCHDCGEQQQRVGDGDSRHSIGNIHRVCHGY
jgi:hypothetical protein